MAARSLPVALILLGLTASQVFAECKLGKVAELPVTMTALRPLVHASINGNDALFLADSGAFYSTLTPAAAEHFKLRLLPAPYWFRLNGVGGEAQAWITTVKTFTIFDLPVPNVQFLVAGNEIGAGAAGILGQNVFRAFGDIEYDLADGVIRMFRTKDCGSTPLAYWAPQAYSVIDIGPATDNSPHTATVAFLNGARIRVLFDTGASTSVLSLEAAKRAGVTPDSPGVVAAGESAGIGPQTVKSWIAPFASFKIGDEEVRNTRLRIGATLMHDVDMLVGADFFLSHRIFVANSQHKLYFTYNGGPVFNLTTTATAAGASADAAPAGTAPVASAPETPSSGAAAPQDVSAGGSAVESPAQTAAGQPTDASGFARRGAAWASRRDFQHAIADLSRACELAPAEASYFYQRGIAYWSNKQGDLALADFNQALKLRPDDLPSLVARATMYLQRKDAAAAIADLDAANRLATREADVRLQMGDLYLRSDQLPSAIAQYTLWIDSHGREDVKKPHALNLRCWSRALLGQQLDEALADCDAAVKSKPDMAAYLDSRGLVRLRRGEYDRAIADYDRAIALAPKGAWSYYGRGVARIRKGLTAGGQSDIAAATALESDIAERAGSHGIEP
ncbi:MAG TPA: aspartyl protease family protein [Steroidobacteraceae bacterium]|jgi:tetratricopeptide (TPR) repeat protein/predicted aspartyl protease|nr:aspartyl protease family protein [Steroidobacteraceae bacterium]